MPGPSNQTDALIELIEGFRSELESEIPRRLHRASGDSGADYTQQHVARKVNGRKGPGTTGLPFTGQFARYLGHSEEYGYEFIAAASFDEIAAYCRSKHVDSAGAMLHATGPTDSLCKRMAVAVVEMRQPVAFVAAQEGIGIFNVRTHLVDVLRHAEKWRGKKREAATAHDEDMEPVSLNDMLRRQHNEAFEERVWNRTRAAHVDWRGEPLLPEWEVERVRRLEQHRKLGCPECMTRAA